MKRSDLPYFTRTSPDDSEREYFLLGGTARGTLTYARKVTLKKPDPIRGEREAVVITIPYSLFEAVEWDTIRRLTEEEAREAGISPIDAAPPKFHTS